MGSVLATPDDVAAALLRPLTDNESTYVITLLQQASALLRTAAPSIDDRIERFQADPADRSAIDPVTVASVVAGAVKRYMINPTGIASESDGSGPYSHSVSYALRSEKESRGTLQITSDDLLTLFPLRKRLRAGTVRTRASLAPRPVGRYGLPVTLNQAVESELTFGTPKQPVLDTEAFLVVDEGPRAS